MAFDRKTGKDTENRSVEKRAVTRLLILVALTAALFAVYKLFTGYFGFDYIFFIYFGLELLFIVVYLCYNRGLSLKGVTKDMLPDTMSDTEKEKLLSGAEMRLKRSAWMLIVIIALLFTLIFDMIELYVIPMIFGGLQ